jgi:hypothetical protein
MKMYVVETTYGVYTYHAPDTRLTLPSTNNTTTITTAEGTKTLERSTLIYEIDDNDQDKILWKKQNKSS